MIEVKYVKKPVVKRHFSRVEKKFRDQNKSELTEKNKSLFKNIKITRDMHNFIETIGINKPIKFM